MSVLYGASFDDVVILDLDGISLVNWGLRYPQRLAHRIGSRFSLGDCLIILSSYDGFKLNLHLVYQRIMPWPDVHHIIKTLAREGILEKKLASLEKHRGHFTTRHNEKNGGDVPFPISYVQSAFRRREPPELWTGISKWVSHWKISRDID